jgi:prophage tail gpP-like protein
MASTVSERQQKGKVADQVAQGALYRLLVYRDENARTAEQIEAAARRCVAERLKDTLYYHATVKGHADPRTGAIWTVDTMVNVDDDVADVHEPLWIESRTLRFGSGGAETDLVCWRPESFTLGPTVWGGTPKAKPATTPKTKPGDRVGSAVGETQDANAGQ